MEDYREVNRAWWDERAPAHAGSRAYAVDRFLTDPEHLSDVVRFDLPRLGRLDGLRGIHLQCHIGTDTLSLHRLGATMSGLDLSPGSLAQARALADRAGAVIDYREGEVYAATELFGSGGFDLVFTGIGALGWLPDIDRWAAVVSDLLRTGGRLFLREGHPMMLALGDPRPDGLVTVEYPYFTTDEPLVWDEPGTYVETTMELVLTRTLEWSHGLGEVVSALLAHGLLITTLVEHDSVPWEARPGEMRRDADGEYRMLAHPERIPLSYTLTATRC